MPVAEQGTAHRPCWVKGKRNEKGKKKKRKEKTEKDLLP